MVYHSGLDSQSAALLKEYFIIRSTVFTDIAYISPVHRISDRGKAPVLILSGGHGYFAKRSCAVNKIHSRRSGIVHAFKGLLYNSCIRIPGRNALSFGYDDISVISDSDKSAAVINIISRELLCIFKLQAVMVSLRL